MLSQEHSLVPSDGQPLSQQCPDTTETLKEFSEGKPTDNVVKSSVDCSSLLESLPHDEATVEQDGEETSLLDQGSSSAVTVSGRHEHRPVSQSDSGEPLPETELAESAEEDGVENVGKVCPELTDVCRFSYAALCAYALQKLYGDNPCHREFQIMTMKALLDHLKMDKQTPEAMLAVTRGDVKGGLKDDDFVTPLKEDQLLTTVGLQILPQDLMQLSLRQGHYDPRARVLSRYMCKLLQVDWAEVERFENKVMDILHEEEHQATEEEQKEMAAKAKKRKRKRYALIGLATVGGGTLIGLTGGLAAPLIAAGAGAILGSSAAVALGSTAGIAIIGSLFGVAGAGLTGHKMKKRVGAVEEFEFEVLSEGRQLHLTIAVSGWLTEEHPDFRTAWRCLASSQEQYALRYESKYLLEMGNAMVYLCKMAIKAAANEALKYTVLRGLMMAIAWPATLLGASSVIDNPWSVCTNRTVRTGRQLADVLLSRQQGKRPVTLIGFSLGARVIFYCLLEMAKRKNCEDIVEDVILLGAPVPGNPKDWEPLEKVVAGRVVNGYCRGDWLLKFLYRTASVQFKIAGLEPVEWQNRRMQNIDLTDVVNGHLDYMYKIQDILDVVGVETKDVPVETTPDSLKGWVKLQKDATTKQLPKSTSPKQSRKGSSSKDKVTQADSQDGSFLQKSVEERNDKMEKISTKDLSQTVEDSQEDDTLVAGPTETLLSS